MLFSEKLNSNIPTISFEIFPPKNPAGWGALYSTLGNVSRRSPDFISVTYGAGGSTRRQTVELVARIQRELGIETVAHLTCLGHSAEEIAALLSELEASDVHGLMALRGDPPKDSSQFKPHPEGFAHASDLIEFASSRNSFTIGCACYPETHPEASSPEADIEYLKLKQDRGASFAVSQLFFDNGRFLKFRENAQKAGISIPIIAGIMPVISSSQIQRFQQLSATETPQKLIDFLGDGDDDTIAKRGIEYGYAQCAELIAEGAAGIHLYTLNKSASTIKITDRLVSAGLILR